MAPHRAPSPRHRHGPAPGRVYKNFKRCFATRRGDTPACFLLLPSEIFRLYIAQNVGTIALYGAYADAPQIPGAPRPAYGHSKDDHDDLKQVLLSLGVSGDGGIPLRLGVRDGNRGDRVETPVAIEECLALGLAGVRGIVADSKA